MEQKRGYAENGYAVLPEFLTKAELNAARKSLTTTINQVKARSEQAVSQDEIYRRSIPIEQRLPYVQYERNIKFPPENRLFSDSIRKVANFHRQKAIAALIGSGGKVERAVSEILGPNPVMLHCIAQLKPPLIGTEKKWHQDNAYFSVVPLDAVLGIWIALHDTDEANGCLYVAPAGHRSGPIRHVYDGECSIPPEAIDGDSIMPVPMRAGDGILFNGLLPHSSPPNRSNRRRWSITFHYRKQKSRVVNNQEFDALFVDSSGQAAGCAAAAREASPELEKQWRD